MELTISIKEQKKVPFFLNLLQELDYIEIINSSDDIFSLPIEHKELLEKRIQKVEDGESSFKNWDFIKKKYARKAF